MPSFMPIGSTIIELCEFKKKKKKKNMDKIVLTFGDFIFNLDIWYIAWFTNIVL